MHVAAMKPVYLSTEDVTHEQKQKFLDEGGENSLWKMYTNEVFMEQELATTEQSVTIKDYLKGREIVLKTPVFIKEWLLF
jgi:translation elongation factor EF-Ts